ncbi:MAG: ABC transporter permease [Prevotellaceae bacterium]|nr:ABC transporter permease [Candidatus Colivivens equi]MCQ2076051.1 ABC transporter permease [Bacteroidaceae bacterium]
MKKIKEILGAFLDVLGLELHNLSYYPIYWCCMVVLPLLVIFFFTDIMQEELPKNLPVGIVNLDNTTTSRKIIRKFDSFQLTDIKAFYPNVTEARKAMQKNEIYGYLLLPKGLSEDLIGNRQPHVSFYYNNSILLAGSLAYKEMRAISTMGNSAYTLAKMQKMGYTDRDIMIFLQPITIDEHPVGNPYLNYNAYLSGIILPSCIALFIFLMTAYSIGAEIKFGRSKTLMMKAHNSILIALTGKMLPHTIIFTLIIWFYQYWLYVHLGFPYECPYWHMMFVGYLLVLASQGLAIFIFGIMPSLRMSMSICALWGVLSFSISGFTFPVDAMDPSLRLLSWLFPMRNYFMIYQINIFHGYPMHYAFEYFVALSAFIFLPILVLKHIKKALNEFEYIP